VDRNQYVIPTIRPGSRSPLARLFVLALMLACFAPDAALAMLSGTRQPCFDAGRSKYDRNVSGRIGAELTTDRSRLYINYLAEFPMVDFLERLRNPPTHSVVLYFSFFNDATGSLFLDGPRGLPLSAGSMALFRPQTLWERHKRSVFIGLLTIVASGLAIYLLFEQKELRRARKAQNQLTGMLIKAQEQERSRIAVEIHDDFSQRIAVLALNLGTTAEIITDSPQEAERRLRELVDEVSKLGGDLHTLSHRLHSATLDSLGLVRGVSAFCKEFSTQQGLRIDFSHGPVPASVNPDIALCAFRTVQEAVRNIRKHSGASTASVRLNADNTSIHLIVSDRGVGFDPKKLELSEGLGVRSMAGRVSLLGGCFKIRSNARTGTTVEAWLPLQPKSSFMS